MKDEKYIYIILLLICFLIPLNVDSQSVGINTLTPRATLEVKGLGNTEATKTMRVVNSDDVEIFTILDNGKLGIGQAEPTVKLDLRGTSSNPVIGIGGTINSASSAGAGAIRYMHNTQEVFYSDGVEWMHLSSSSERAYLIARNNYEGGSYPDSTLTRLTGYAIDYDSHQRFDTITSIYTAPVDGLYVVSFTSLFSRVGGMKDQSYVLGRWVSDNGRMLQAVQAYPDGGGSARAKITCSGTIYLKAGDKLWPEIWHNQGITKGLRVYGSDSANPISDTGFNYLSIFAQEIYVN